MITIREASDLYDDFDEDGFLDDTEFDDDFAVGGYDSNGDPIDESTIEELYRVANSEILPTTELAELGDADIPEDTFDYYASGTAFGANLKYDIVLTVGDGAFDLDGEYALEDGGMHPSFMYGDNSAELTFTIKVRGDKVNTVLTDVSIYDGGIYSDRYSENFADYWDEIALCEYVNQLAAPAVEEIQTTLSNI